MHACYIVNYWLSLNYGKFHLNNISKIQNSGMCRRYMVRNNSTLKKILVVITTLSILKVIDWQKTGNKA